MNTIITGATAAIVGDKAGEVLYGKSHLDEHGECVHHDLHKIVENIERMASASPRPPIYQRVTLQPGYLVPMDNERYDRHYNLALVSSSMQIQFEVIGLGQPFTLTLAAGWNVLNMPEHTNWGLTSGAGSNASILYCASDHMFGNAI